MKVLMTNVSNSLLVCVRYLLNIYVWHICICLYVYFSACLNHVLRYMYYNQLTGGQSTCNQHVLILFASWLSYITFENCVYYYYYYYYKTKCVYTCNILIILQWFIEEDKNVRHDNTCINNINKVWQKDNEIYIC